MEGLVIYRITPQAFVWADGAGAASHPSAPATCATLAAEAGSKGKATPDDFWGKRQGKCMLLISEEEKEGVNA